MNAEALLVQAVTYLAAAVISVPLAKRAGLGSVLGYLVAGVVIGPSLLNLIGDPAQVNHVAEFGVVILLFLIGLDVQPSLLWRMRSSIFGVGGAQYVATGLVGTGIAVALGLEWRSAVACGAILTISSDAIVLSILEEKGLRKGAMGDATFGVLLLQDLVVIPLFVFLPLLALDPIAAKAASETPHWLEAAPPWLRPVAVLGAVAAVIVAGQYAVRPAFRYIASAKLREIFTAAALLMVVGVAALMTAVGLPPALGAFLAGVLLAESEFRKELESDIEPFRGILLGLFFMTVGAGLDLGLILRQPLLIAGLVALVMTVKAVVMMGVGKAFRLTWREASGSGVLLSQAGEFAFVLVAFTVGARVLSPEIGKLLMAVAAVSLLMTPLLFLGYERLVDRLQPKAPVRDADTRFQDGAHVIVAGFGRFGQIAGRLLQANDFQLSVMDSSPTQIDLLRKFANNQVNYGDASRLDLLHAAGAAKAKVLIVAIDDKEKAEELVETAKQSFPHLIVLARAFDRGHAYELLAKGADFVERETYEASLAVGREALKRLGMTPYRADRASDIFRRYDLKQFYKMQPMWNLDDDTFIKESRLARATLERLLAADLATLEDSPPEEGVGAAAPLEAVAGGG